MEYVRVAQRVINPPDQDFVDIGTQPPSNLASGDFSVIGKSLLYFKTYFPMLLSLVLGSIILGLIYMLYDYVSEEIHKKLYSSVTIAKKEETYNWINVFIRDSGWVKGDGSLTC